MAFERDDSSQLLKRVKRHNAKVDAAFRAIIDLTPFDHNENDYHLIDSLAQQIAQLRVDYHEILIREQ